MIRVAVGKSHTLVGDRVNVWCGDVGVALHSQIGVPEIVGEQHDDVGPVRR